MRKSYARILCDNLYYNHHHCDSRGRPLKKASPGSRTQTSPLRGECSAFATREAKKETLSGTGDIRSRDRSCSGKIFIS